MLVVLVLPKIPKEEIVSVFVWLVFGKLNVIHSNIRHRIFVVFGKKVSICAFFFS